jgi:hypothetical protein
MEEGGLWRSHEVLLRERGGFNTPAPWDSIYSDVQSYMTDKNATPADKVWSGNILQWLWVLDR